MFGIWHFEIKYFGDSSLNTRFICVHMHFIHTSWRKFCAVFLVILSVGLSVCYVTSEKVKMFRNFSDKRPPPRVRGRTDQMVSFPKAGLGLLWRGYRWNSLEIAGNCVDFWVPAGLHLLDSSKTTLKDKEGYDWGRTGCTHGHRTCKHSVLHWRLMEKWSLGSLWQTACHPWWICS